MTESQIECVLYSALRLLMKPRVNCAWWKTAIGPPVRVLAHNLALLQSELRCQVFYHTRLALSGVAPAAEQSSAELLQHCGACHNSGTYVWFHFFPLVQYWPFISKQDGWWHISRAFWLAVFFTLRTSRVFRLRGFKNYFKKKKYIDLFVLWKLNITILNI